MILAREPPHTSFCTQLVFYENTMLIHIANTLSHITLVRALVEAFQVSRAMQTVGFVRATSRASLCIYAGNVGGDSGSCGYELMTAIGGLRDAYIDTNAGPESQGETFGEWNVGIYVRC
jgi:hypothetical protein